jgi:hypothetical protein
MSKKLIWWMLALSLMLAAAGLLLPFWPLSFLGMLLAALLGRWILAIILGLVLDSIYGAPIGSLHVLYFPFTLAALVAVVLRYYVSAFILPGRKDTL